MKIQLGKNTGVADLTESMLTIKSGRITNVASYELAVKVDDVAGITVNNCAEAKYVVKPSNLDSIKSVFDNIYK